MNELIDGHMAEVRKLREQERTLLELIPMLEKSSRRYCDPEPLRAAERILATVRAWIREAQERMILDACGRAERG
jgi:hypothetical protein